MSQSFVAIFDGEVLRPEQPLQMEPNTRVRITVEPETIAETPSHSFLRKARSLNLQGPEDWSERIEDYLYGNNDNAVE